MQTVSLPHYAKIPRTAAMLVAAAILVAVLVLALVDVTGGPRATVPAHRPSPPGRSTRRSPSTVTSTSCLYLHQPC